MAEQRKNKGADELKRHSEYLEKLINEYDGRLKIISGQLIKEAAKRKKAEEEKEALLDNVGLRIKELNCLYGLSELIEKHKDSLADIFNGLVYLIPPAWQYPEATAARIIFNDREFKTDDFEITAWMQSAEMKVFDEKAGAIEVSLLEERPAADEGPFLKEEAKLIHVIAERLGRIVEGRQMKEEIVRARKLAEANYNKLKELEGLKDSLTHMIVHDLNNPLNVASGNMELLGVTAQDRLTEEQGSFLEKSLRATQELKNMIGNLLDINKMEEGKLKLVCDEFNLGDVAKDVADQMRVVAEKDGKALVAYVPKDVPAISADIDLIKRVIANLTNNALKFTPEKGSVTIGVAYNDSGKAFRISVKDTGPGIPKGYLDKVFDKFVQVKTKQSKKGRGLGLTFCKMAVEAHGGRIWVESAEGHGSTFIFTLPDNK